MIKKEEKLMHIPSSKTSDIAIEEFRTALKNSEIKCDGYDNTKWIYVPNTYSEYRYILGTRGERPLVCIGINPSTAEPDNLDNTLKSVERIALANGYDSFIMFNVYAQRATRPEDMERELNTYMHEQNMAAFEYIMSLSKKSAPAVWAAWGTIIEMRGYLPECVRDMIEIGKKYGAVWYTAGARSKKAGHPHHPLYLSKTSTLEPFSDISEYLDSLIK